MLKISEIIGAGMHIGKSKRENTAHSVRYISGYRAGASIFSLGSTSFFLSRAMNFVERAVYKYARGFFYGLSFKDKKSARLLKKFNQVVSGGNWGGGFLTNTRRFRGRILNIRKVPHFVVCFRFGPENYSVLREKKRLKLPLIAPIDSNSSPEWMEYPIPSNSYGQGTSYYLAHCFSKSVFGGISTRLWRLKRVIIPKFKKRQYRRCLRMVFRGVRKKITRSKKQQRRLERLRERHYRRYSKKKFVARFM
jgi:ribosomal protein S2